MARIVSLLILVSLLAPPVALAADPPAQQAPSGGSSLLQDAPQQAPAEPIQQAPVQQTTEVDDGSIGPAELLLVAVGIAALIGGIWFVIARDARRATAGRTRTAAGDLAAGSSGGATRAAHRSRRLSAAERKRRKRGRAH